MRTPALKLAVRLALVVMLAATSLAIAAPAPASPKAGVAPFDPHILSVIKAEGRASFFVVLKAQADLSGAIALTEKEAKGQYVFDALTEVADRTQGPIVKALTARGVTFEPFWIRNMIRVQGDEALLLEMAARPDVAEIVYEYEPVLDLDPPTPNAAGPEAVEWNIVRVNADDVWTTWGITGTGAVVASLDTGVQWDHPALVNSYRPQIAGAPGRHDYNWWDGPGGSTTPVDYDSHGTHTVGTMVGDDGGANQVGMAPGAHWIACPGLGAHATPMDCFQFFLAPTKLDGSDPRPDLAPHVINNSWSSATDYHAIIETLYAAGIFYAKSAGNTGSSCGSITNPGQWPEVMATANFRNGDYISGSSSRGPMTLGHDVIIKPDIAAPGTSVRSAVPGNTYGLKSGTSMASPHVAGAVALLISAKPQLAGQVDLLQMILKQTAEPKVDLQCPPNGPGGIPNNVWGYGILDAYSAVNMALGMGLGDISGQVYDSSTMNPIAEAEITFEDATGWHLFETSASNGNYSRTLPAGTYSITTTRYGYLPHFDASVAVVSGSTAVHDIPLDPAPVWTVSGTVTETQTGDPLVAQVLFEETPISTETNPDNGGYSASVAQGTWWMQASSPGHAGAERLVQVDQDMVEDFALPAIFNYYMKTGTGACGPGFDWMDATGGTAHSLSDDSYKYVSLPSGHSFTFYGTTYTGFYLGSNGHVTFGAGDNKWSGPIPDPATPNNGIYAFSTDLNPASGSQGHIYTDLFDNRYYVIQFDAVEHYPSGDPETFEIVLDLDSGLVTVLFQTVSDASEAVVGVENAAGTEATQYAYADPVLVDDNVAVEFYPNFGTPPPTGDEGDLEGVVFDAFNMAPLAGASITLEAYTTGEGFILTTNASGEYSDTLCADWYTATASAFSHYPAQVRVAVISGTQSLQDIYLEPWRADLWIEKTAGATHAMPGDLLTYTILVGNSGPGLALNVGLSDLLPPGTTYVTSTMGGPVPLDPSQIDALVGDLLPGQEISLTLTVALSPTLEIGTVLTNTVLVSSGVTASGPGPGTPDPDGDNNTAIWLTIVGQQNVVYLPLVIKGGP